MMVKAYSSQYFQAHLLKSLGPPVSDQNARAPSGGHTDNCRAGTRPHGPPALGSPGTAFRNQGVREKPFIFFTEDVCRVVNFFS